MIRPKILVFFTSYNCNLRCAMCSAWVKQKLIKEPTLDEVRAIFNDDLLRNNLEVINITGGEPTLRADLAEIVKIILQKCSRLKRIDISTNGVNTPQVIDQVERILALLLPIDVRLTASISLDGVGAMHEQVRQTAGIFNKVEQTIEGLKELKGLYHFFDVGLNMTISKLNYKSIEEVKRYAQRIGVGVNFTLSAISEIGVESIKLRDKFEMNQGQKDAVASFFKELPVPGELSQQYLDFLNAWLLNGKRQGNCAFRQGKSLLLEPNGEIYLCGNFKEFGIGNLLQASLKQLSKFNRDKLAKQYKIKCAGCNSNCYIENKT